MFPESCCALCWGPTAPMSITYLRNNFRRSRKFAILVSRYLNYTKGRRRETDQTLNILDGNADNAAEEFLCGGCRTVIESFCQMYDLYFNVQLQMNLCLGKIAGIIKDANNNGSNGKDVRRRNRRKKNRCQTISLDNEKFREHFLKKVEKKNTEGFPVLRLDRRDTEDGNYRIDSYFASTPEQTYEAETFADFQLPSLDESIGENNFDPLQSDEEPVTFEDSLTQTSPENFSEINLPARAMIKQEGISRDTTTTRSTLQADNLHEVLLVESKSLSAAKQYLKMRTECPIYEEKGTCAGKKKTFRCKFCGKLLPSQLMLREHLELHEGEPDPLQCIMCAKNHVTIPGLENHLRKHTREKPFPCSICLKSFKSTIARRSHKRTFHNRGKKSYVCETCWKAYGSRAALAQHLLIHTGVKHYRCNLCSYSCAFKSNLRVHMAAHLPGRRYFKPEQLPQVKDAILALEEKKYKPKYKLVPKKQKLESLCLDASEHKSNIDAAYKRESNATLQDSEPGDVEEAFIPVPEGATNQERQEDLKEDVGEVSPTNQEHQQETPTTTFSPLNIAYSDDPKKPYKCTVCSKCFTIPSLLVEHFRLHTGERPFKCTHNLCARSFIRKSLLNQHMRTHETGGSVHSNLCRRPPLKCKFCERTFAFRNKGRLHAHEAGHTGYNPYSCIMCPSIFLDNRALEVHMRNHTQERPFSCAVCRSCFISFRQRRDHMGSKHPEKINFNCSYCKRGFHQRKSLRYHLRLKHNVLLAPVIKPRLQISSSVKEASENIEIPVKMEANIGIADPLQFNMCTACGKCFKRLGQLILHERRHSGFVTVREKSYICIQCGKCFTTAGNLARHEQNHTGIKPFECQICNQKFINKDRLTRHVTTHSNTTSKPFKCEICHKGYIREEGLALHKTRMHENRRGKAEESSGESEVPIPHSSEVMISEDNVAPQKEA